MQYVSGLVSPFECAHASMQVGHHATIHVQYVSGVASPSECAHACMQVGHKPVTRSKSLGLFRRLNVYMRYACMHSSMKSRASLDFRSL